MAATAACHVRHEQKQDGDRNEENHDNHDCRHHTIKGKRTEKKRTEMKVASNEWHALRVDFQGNHFIVTFDGKKAIEWDDDTFKEAGKVGVWTKADSVTEFDDFSYASR